MPDPVLMLAAASTLGAAAVFLELMIGGRSMLTVRDESRGGVASPGGQPTPAPRVSIIVAALNEGPHIERALRSVLAQDYPDFEVIAIDDRSTDDTGAILDRMARSEPRLRVVHIQTLPTGWLGKNHALQRGASVATGDILVFTDADIVYAPSAIGQAVAFMEHHVLDHLAMAPELDLPTAPLALTVNFFTLWFLAYYKPWKAPSPRSKRHLGIGAFNGIRRSLYERFEGHTRIALRPDDDIKLGKLVKLAGGKQLVANGVGLIRVAWYANLGELVRGFRKNTFAGLEYSVLLAIGAVIAQLTLNVWPFVALFVMGGAAWWFNAATAAILMITYAIIAHVAGSRPWLAVFYPVAALIFTYIIVAATARTLVRGGIEWRGTFYPLSTLRKNTVR